MVYECAYVWGGHKCACVCVYVHSENSRSAHGGAFEHVCGFMCGPHSLRVGGTWVARFSVSLESAVAVTGSFTFSQARRGADVV